MKSVFLAALAAAVLMIAPAGAAERESVLDRVGDMGRAGASKISAAPSAASGNSLRMVIASELTVQPGSFKDLGEVPADFSGASDLAVSAIASAGSFNGVSIVVGWAAYGEYFAAADVIKGSLFVDKTTGGARIPVYGPAARVFIANDGTAAVTVRQLAIYTTFR